MQGGLIEVFKILRGMDEIDSHNLYPKMVKPNSRGHNFKVSGEDFLSHRGYRVLGTHCGGWLLRQILTNGAF